MKKILFALLFTMFVYGQPEHTGEFIIGMVNFGSSWNVTFEATAVSETWDEDYHLTAGYQSASVTLNGQQTVPPHTPTAYFDLIVDPLAGEHPIMALGRYRISAVVGGTEQAYFFMDWRTSDYGSCPDVYFKYDVANHDFKNAANTQTIDGTTQAVWDLVSGIDHVTTGLELYCDVVNNNSHPKVQFNAYHGSGTVATYYIYKKKDSDSFTKIAETTNLYYTDNTETVVTGAAIQNETKAKYKVSAYLTNSTESLKGNESEIRVEGEDMEKRSNPTFDSATKYLLLQNYPNPFNPSTVISFELQTRDFVNLSIYNSLGEVVAVLINTQLGEGYHAIKFDASSLPAGVYMYKLQAGQFTDVRKMLFVK